MLPYHSELQESVKEEKYSRKCHVFKKIIPSKKENREGISVV